MQPLVVLILLQAAILLTFLYLSGIFDQVNSNERAILSKQVANRANYLESQMTQQWADIGALAASINEKTQAAVDAGELSLDRLESSSKEAAKLIGQICTDMIETMYRNKVSGIYVIFSTSNLDGSTESKTGFHVRDLDPTVSAAGIRAMTSAPPTAITFESRSWRPIERKSGCRRTITAAGAPARSPTCPPG